MKTSKDTTDKTTKKYWAFISYRHADNLEQDRDWASWLHKSIETYDVPAELIGTKNDRGDIIPERIYPVFRDEESLPADADLANSITNALDSSNFLVALCSPRAVESKYVAQEIEHFKATGKGNRIIAAIIAGEPGHPENECFPEPIREVVNQDGKLSEPIAADFRRPDGKQGYTSAEAYKKHLLKTLPKKEASKKAEKYDERLQLMKLKIIAGIIGKPLETIRDRDKSYQLELARKRTNTLRKVATAMLVLLLLTLLGGYGFYIRTQEAEAATQRAKTAKELAESQHYLGLLREASQSSSQGEYANAIQRLSECPTEIRGKEWDLLTHLTPSVPIEFRLSDATVLPDTPFGNSICEAIIELLRGGGIENNQSFENDTIRIETGANGYYAGVISFYRNSIHESLEESWLIKKYLTKTGGPVRSIITKDGSCLVVLSTGVLEGDKFPIKESSSDATNSEFSEYIIILPIPHELATLRHVDYHPVYRGKSNLIIANGREPSSILEVINNDSSILSSRGCDFFRCFYAAFCSQNLSQ